ncbi:MAG TPA: helix-turn-helix transcriptional regulator [Streptosporangiaceae bacterium]|nr:helix-turn-helix transcriptional regulator [Streptosporangiaceae bacterium]
MEPVEEWLSQPGGLAARLRALRVRAGLSGKQLADTHGWAQSKVSRIETGHQLPSVADIHAWAGTTGADADTLTNLLRAREDARIAHATFAQRMRRGQAKVQQTYNDLVAGATLVRHFETVYIPGLLQVPGYARRVLEEMVTLHGPAAGDVAAALAGRLQRQQSLYDPAKRFEFLLAEPVLRFLLVPPPVMLAQLDRLQTVIGLDNVRFGVVPMGTQLATTPQNSVQIYLGEQTIAVTETFIGETWHRNSDADAYGRALDRMWEEAVTGDDARRLITAASIALLNSTSTSAASSVSR